MSLEQYQIKEKIFHPILAVGFINFVLIINLLIMSTTIFAKPSGVLMEFPSYREGISQGREITMMVTSENVIYVEGRVVTLNELKHFLAVGDFRRNTLILKVDPHASMGRVADILDLCRGIPGANVNVSTIL